MLEYRITPMPYYMMDQILAGEDTVSAKEVLEAKKAWWDGEGTRAYVRSLDHFKGDSLTTANEDSLNWVFDYNNMVEAQYDKVSWLHHKGEYSQAENVLESVSLSFDLNPYQVAINEALSDFYDLLEKIHSDTAASFNVDSITSSSLQLITTSNNGIPGAYARNILIAAGMISYQEPILLPDPGLKKVRKEKFRGVKESGNTGNLTVFPNPANEYCVVRFHLDRFTSQGSIDLYDINGRKVQSHNSIGSQNQLLLSTESLGAGLYILVLKVDGEYIGSVKLAIMK
jgi:hypothetical protein